MSLEEGKWFEEFLLGDKYSTTTRTVTESDIMAFVNLVGIHHPLFRDIDFIEKQTPFKRRIAPGPLTYTFAEGLGSQTGLFSRCMAFLGMNMRILAPVFCNDTIHVDIEVTEKRETSNPERGIVTFLNTVRNQHGEAVLTYAATRMSRRRQG